MKQILQNLKNGEIEIADVPCPAIKPGHVLIRSRVSLISAGTERMMLQFGKAGYLDKARQQPDKVRQVINKIKTDGLIPTVEAVRSKLDQPMPLGYCNVGVVIDTGSQSSEFHIGDRVASNGHHAEMVCVPENLCIRIPDSVSDEEAAFTVLGSIGLQGVRLANPTLGECFVVSGLGLVGLLTVQILKASGCRVLGIDYDKERLKIAQQFGAEIFDLSINDDPVPSAISFSGGFGADGVIICAATQSNEPVHQAALMCRKRGRIILVGVTGLKLSRDDFYKKEISFQVSCSYGPGRYDPAYEEKGQDYPIGFVRWTEKRNFSAVLNLMAEKRVDVSPLISNRFPLDQATAAYEMIDSTPALGVLLEYSSESERSDETLKNQTIVNKSPIIPISKSGINIFSFVKEIKFPSFLKNGITQTGIKKQAAVVGFIGAGEFSKRILVPALKKTDAKLKSVASSGSVNNADMAKKFGFERATTDVQSIFDDPEINTVFITTRHDSHAEFVIKAVQAGKHVFVEKPLCITHDQLDKITALYEEKLNTGYDGFVMTGFNRRFAPHVKKMKELLDTTNAPRSMIMTVNAGAIPSDHWTQDQKIGGGRIIGEACHYVDLLRFLAGVSITDVSAAFFGKPHNRKSSDSLHFTLQFADGSLGTIFYLANGNRMFPKERLEVFCDGKILQLDNFRVLKGYGWKNFNKMKLWTQDKGHTEEVSAFIRAVQSGDSPPIPFEEIVETTKITFKISETI